MHACIALHCITLHFIALHCISSHYIALHCITTPQSTLRYITHTTLHYTTLHYITLHYITLHYITLHYITLHYITLHYITLRYMYNYNFKYDWSCDHNYNDITLRCVTVRCTTLHCTALHKRYITLHSISFTLELFETYLHSRTHENSFSVYATKASFARPLRLSVFFLKRTKSGFFRAVDARQASCGPYVPEGLLLCNPLPKTLPKVQPTSI